jgi:hypothetical protein
VHTLLLGTIDVDSPVDAPRPFFASADEVLSLDRDRRSYMFELQESWEDQCAPRPSAMEFRDLAQWAVELLAADEGDDGPLLKLRPVLRLSCTRLMAGLLLNSQQLKLGFGSGSDSPLQNAQNQKTTTAATAIE